MKYGTLRAAALLTLIVAGPAMASDTIYGANDIEVSLNARYDTSRFQFDDGHRVDTRYTRVSGTLYQTTFPWFQPGINVGTGWMSTDGDPPAEGLAPNGQSIGLLVRSVIPLLGALSIQAHASWIYHDLSDSENDTDVTYAWHDYYGRLGLAGHFGPVAVAGGATARKVDGERRVHGQDTAHFDSDQDTGYYGSAAFYLDPTGRIELEMEGGARQSVTVRFARQF